MGGVAKVFKSVTSFATQMASSLGTSGIFGMMQKALGLADKVSKALKPLSPKGFAPFDKKLMGFLGPANKALSGANAFLKQAAAKAVRSPVAPPKPVATLHINIAPPAGVFV